jgi:hypothetical protein
MGSESDGADEGQRAESRQEQEDSRLWGLSTEHGALVDPSLRQRETREDEARARWGDGGDILERNIACCSEENS